MHLERTNSTEPTSMDVQDLVCPICLSIADDPRVSTCCHRVFCVKDADPSRYENGCPLCRQSNYSFQPSPKHKALLEEQTMKCSCSERILPRDYDVHMERCSHISFPCPHDACREKNDSTKYNAPQLVNHLARAHCDEVPLLGSTYVDKKSLEPYKQVANKYEDLVSTLYSSVYPRIIDTLLSASNSLHDSPIFKCPHVHKLILADRNTRKRKDGTIYSSPGYNCDICHRTFSSGPSWHCSCSSSGFDKCVACVAFQLFELDNDILQLAGKDNEEFQQRYRRRQSVRNMVRLPRGLFRLLAGSMESNEDGGEDTETLSLRRRSLLSQRNVFDDDNDELESNLRED